MADFYRQSGRIFPCKWQDANGICNLDGNTPYYLFELDFPYEFQQRWKKMRHEDPEYADMLYNCFIERGTDVAHELSDEKRLQLFRELYEDALQGVW